MRPLPVHMNCPVAGPALRGTDGVTTNVCSAPVRALTPEGREDARLCAPTDVYKLCVCTAPHEWLPDLFPPPELAAA